MSRPLHELVRDLLDAHRNQIGFREAVIVMEQRARLADSVETHLGHLRPRGETWEAWLPQVAEAVERDQAGTTR